MMRWWVIFVISLLVVMVSHADQPAALAGRLAGEQAGAYKALYKKRLEEYFSDHSTNAPARLFEAGRTLQKDYPGEVMGYYLMLFATEHADILHCGQPRDWAKELTKAEAPERVRSWAKGFLHRLDLRGKPLTMKFTDVDGRRVDLAQMQGKVVLVDFWATGCAPCVEELPRVKAAYEKYRQDGFEVIGISCDANKPWLKRFLKEHKDTWPQYFDGHGMDENQFVQEFGIYGIPDMFLVDRQGRLRYDNVRAWGAADNFEGKIEQLLAEPPVTRCE